MVTLLTDAILMFVLGLCLKCGNGDPCNGCSLYAGLPACRLGSLDRVVRSAARLIGGIPKFGHVSQYMLDVLHWLPAEQRISYRIASLVWRCLVGLAPVYLRELCCPPLSAMSSRSLRSSQ